MKSNLVGSRWDFFGQFLFCYGKSFDFSCYSGLISNTFNVAFSNKPVSELKG